MTFRESWWLEGLYRDENDYYRYDGEMTAEQFFDARCDVGRNEGPALLFDLCAAGSIDLGDIGMALADVWSMCEFPFSAFDPPTMWVELFELAGYTVDGRPAPPPVQPITLYRGCHHDRRFGMSWTTDLERAKWFAERDLGHGVGNVYTVVAQPEWLLAYIGDGSRGESEFVVDPDYLNDGVVRGIANSAGLRDFKSLTSVEPALDQ